MSRNKREGHYIGKHFGKDRREPRPTTYEVDKFYDRSIKSVGCVYAPYFYLG